MLDKFCSSPHQVAFGGGLVKGWGDLDQRGLVATQGKGEGSWGLVQPLLASRELDPPRKVSLCWHGRFNDPKVDAASLLRSPPRAAAVPRQHVARQNTHENMLPGKTHMRQPFVKYSLMGQVLTIKHWDFAGDGLFGIARKHPEDLPEGTCLQELLPEVVTRGRGRNQAGGGKVLFTRNLISSTRLRRGRFFIDICYYLFLDHLGVGTHTTTSYHFKETLISR